MADFLNYDFQFSYEKEPELVEEFVDEGFRIKKLLPWWQKHWDNHNGIFERDVIYSLVKIETILRERGLNKFLIIQAMRQWWRRGLVERFRERKKDNTLGNVYYRFKAD